MKNKCGWEFAVIGGICPAGPVGWVNRWQAASLHVQFSSVAQLCLTLQHHGLQHARPHCPSPTPRVYSNSCPLSQWWHPTISTPVVPFTSCLQSSPASRSFPMSQLFTSGSQSIGVSASTSVLPMNTQDWSPLGWTCWISLQSKGLSRVFSNTTVQKLACSLSQYTPMCTYGPTFIRYVCIPNLHLGPLRGIHTTVFAGKESGVTWIWMNKT